MVNVAKLSAAEERLRQLGDRFAPRVNAVAIRNVLDALDYYRLLVLRPPHHQTTMTKIFASKPDQWSK